MSREIMPQASNHRRPVLQCMRPPARQWLVRVVLDDHHAPVGIHRLLLGELPSHTPVSTRRCCSSWAGECGWFANLSLILARQDGRGRFDTRGRAPALQKGGHHLNRPRACQRCPFTGAALLEEEESWHEGPHSYLGEVYSIQPTRFTRQPGAAPTDKGPLSGQSSAVLRVLCRREGGTTSACSSILPCGKT